MQALRDDDEHLSELDTNPLAQLDSERVRVQSELCEAIAKGRCTPSDDAVPTELLAEDLEVEIELPQREPCEALRLERMHPAGLWVRLGPGQVIVVHRMLGQRGDAVAVEGIVTV